MFLPVSVGSVFTLYWATLQSAHPGGPWAVGGPRGWSRHAEQTSIATFLPHCPAARQLAFTGCVAHFKPCFSARKISINCCQGHLCSLLISAFAGSFKKKWWVVSREDYWREIGVLASLFCFPSTSVDSKHWRFEWHSWKEAHWYGLTRLLGVLAKQSVLPVSARQLMSTAIRPPPPCLEQNASLFPNVWLFFFVVVFSFTLPLYSLMLTEVIWLTPNSPFLKWSF